MADPAALLTLQQTLGYRFTDPALLDLALTHRSWVEERYPGGNAPAHESQQRLEFLGDALLGYVVGRWLYRLLPHAPEGDLTSRRMVFTQGTWLSARGDILGLDPLVRRGRGEAANLGGTAKLLEDTTEALIGAILLDGGEAAAIAVIESWLPAQAPAPPEPDSIAAFNEWYQAKFRKPPPEPTCIAVGPDLTPPWCAMLGVDGIEEQGSGRTKQEAKRDLYRKLLAALAAATAP